MLGVTLGLGLTERVGVREPGRVTEACAVQDKELLREPLGLPLAALEAH